MTDSFPVEPEPPEPPEVLEAQWPAEKIVELFDDLSLGAEVQHVQLRSQGGQEERVTLQQARRSFLSGEALAIQIKYHFDGEVWCDTLLPAPVATKIIRTRPGTVQQPEGPNEHCR